MPRFSLAKLRVRLLLLVLLAIIPALALMVYSNLELRQMAADDARKEAARLVRLAASDQADSIRDTRQFLFALAQIPQVRDAGSVDCSAFFAQILQQYPQYAALGVISPAGDIICSAYPTGAALNVADRLYFQRVLETRDFAVSDYQIDPVSGKATLNFGYPVLGELGHVETVVFASLDLSWLNDLAAQAELPAGSTFTVIDRNGTVLVRYPDPGIWVGRSVPEAPIVETILSQPGEGTVEAAGVDNIPRLFAFTPLYGLGDNGDVYVSIGIPTAVALADANRLLARNLAGLAIVTLLALTAAWFGGYWFILRWVRVLVDATNRLRDGNLETRTGLPYGQGELSQLAQAFDEMAEALQRRVFERDRAEETLGETQRVLATLAMLYEVTAVAGESLDLETILNRSLAQVVAVMEAELGTIHLFDEGKNELHLAARHLAPQSDEAGSDHLESISIPSRGGSHATAGRTREPGPLSWDRRLLPDSELVNRVFEQRRPLFGPNFETQPEAPLAAYLAGHASPSVGVPMRVRGRVMGVLTLVGPTGHEFTPEAVALLASIADQVAVGVDNAQLFDAERVRRHQADTLLQVTSVVGSTLDLEEVLARILDQLRRVVAYDSASVQLLAEDELQVIAARGFAEVQEVLGAKFPQSEPPYHQVVTRGQPLNLSDAPALYPAFRRPPFHHIRSWLGVPLRVQERVIGIIAVGRRESGGYGEEEVRLTTAFADQAALALENARLYQQAEQLAVLEERNRLARELHDSVTQSLYSLTLFAEVGRRSTEAGNVEQALDYLHRLGQVAQQALREMRLLVYELRMPALETEGLVRALQHRLDAVEKRAGVEARVLGDGVVELPPSVEEGLYRIAQEALNNSLKHAAATQVTVRIETGDDMVELEVADNGRAFDPNSLRDGGGMGLPNMRERAERLGGSLVIVSKPGSGTSIKVSVPTRRSWSRPVLPIDRLSEVL